MDQAVQIQSNAQLSACSCGLFGVVGTLDRVTIRDNAPGCNSVDDITAPQSGSCRFPVNGELEPVETDYNFVLGPNPTQSALTLGFTLSEPAEVDIAVFTILGQLVTRYTNLEPAGQIEMALELQDVASGPYVLRFGVDGDVVQTTQFTLVR